MIWTLILAMLWAGSGAGAIMLGIWWIADSDRVRWRAPAFIACGMICAACHTALEALARIKGLS